MSTLLSADGYAAALWEFERSAFRLETQPAYFVPEEQDLLAQLRDGRAATPEAVPELAEWYARVAERTRGGARMGRVRIYDDPMPDYQRWGRQFDRFNVAAGEEVRYLARRRAHEIGLLPAAGPGDWWLFDEAWLLMMRFDAAGQMTSAERVVDPTAVARAIVWRDLAILHSAVAGSPGAPTA